MFVAGCSSTSPSIDEPISLTSESGTVQIEKIKKDPPEVEDVALPDSLTENTATKSTFVEANEAEENESETDSTPKSLDCNETCSRAESGTDGVLSEKECLLICHDAVAKCDDQLAAGEIPATLLELCGVGYLVQEAQARYPELEDFSK